MVRKKQPDGSHVVRLMTGVEAMRAIGWDTGDWRTESDTYGDDLLRSLAGNAFSCYQIGPVLAATFASFGLPENMLTVHEKDKDEDVLIVDDVDLD